MTSGSRKGSGAGAAGEASSTAGGGQAAVQEVAVDLKQYDMRQLVSMLNAVGDKLFWEEELVPANITVASMTPEEKAALFYWYQYNHWDWDYQNIPGDERIRTTEHLDIEEQNTYHAIIPSDIPDILEELTGSCSRADLKAVEDYVVGIQDGEYLMWATGDFGDAGDTYLTSEGASAAMENGRLKIDGYVQQYDYNTYSYHPTRTFTGYFLPNEDSIIAGYQFDQLIIH